MEHPPHTLLVSNMGRTRRLVSGQMFTCTPRPSTANGYATIYIASQKQYMHRVVAATFLDIMMGEGTVVDHIDRVKQHNMLANLRCASVVTNNLNKTQMTDPGKARAVRCDRHASCAM